MSLPSLGEQIRLRRGCLRTRKRQNRGEFTIIIGGTISLQFLTGSLHKMDIIGQLLLWRGLNLKSSAGALFGVFLYANVQHS